MSKSVSCHVLLLLALLSMVVSGCSTREESSEAAKGGDKAVTEQAAEAIKEYGRKPMDKARAAQRLGEERTKAIDEAAKTQ